MDNTSCGAVAKKMMRGMLPVESSDEDDGTLRCVITPGESVKKYLYGATQWRVATTLNH